jgi:hypothetical protein
MFKRPEQNLLSVLPNEGMMDYRVNVQLDREQAKFIERESARIGRLRTEVIARRLMIFTVACLRAGMWRPATEELNQMAKDKFDVDTPPYSASTCSKSKRKGGPKKSADVKATAMNWPRHSLRPALSTTQFAVIFCETSDPTKRVIDSDVRITGQRRPDRGNIGRSRAGCDYRMYGPPSI